MSKRLTLAQRKALRSAAAKKGWERRRFASIVKLSSDPRLGMDMGKIAAAYPNAVFVPPTPWQRLCAFVRRFGRET